MYEQIPDMVQVLPAYKMSNLKDVHKWRFSIQVLSSIEQIFQKFDKRTNTTGNRKYLTKGDPATWHLEIFVRPSGE